MPFTLKPAADGNYLAGRNGDAIQCLVIHTTACTEAAALQRFQSPGTQVSAHYIVGLDGSVTQVVDEANAAYHSGDFNTNLISIGIEHVDDGNYNDPRPDALYAASAALVAELCARYSIPIDRVHIRKHSEIVATGCPDGLDVERIVSQAQGGTDLTPEESAQLAGIYASFQHLNSIPLDQMAADIAALKADVDALKAALKTAP